MAVTAHPLAILRSPFHAQQPGSLPLQSLLTPSPSRQVHFWLPDTQKGVHAKDGMLLLWAPYVSPNSWVFEGHGLVTSLFPFWEHSGFYPNDICHDLFAALCHQLWPGSTWGPSGWGILGSYCSHFLILIPVRDLVYACHAVFLQGESTVFNDCITVLHLPNEIQEVSIPWWH